MEPGAVKVKTFGLVYRLLAVACLSIAASPTVTSNDAARAINIFLIKINYI
jgi:hypothetical protein